MAGAAPHAVTGGFLAGALIQRFEMTGDVHGERFGPHEDDPRVREAVVSVGKLGSRKFTRKTIRANYGDVVWPIASFAPPFSSRVGISLAIVDVPEYSPFGAGS